MLYNICVGPSSFFHPFIVPVYIKIKVVTDKTEYTSKLRVNHSHCKHFLSCCVQKPEKYWLDCHKITFLFTVIIYLKLAYLYAKPFSYAVSWAFAVGRVLASPFAHVQNLLLVDSFRELATECMGVIISWFL